jgi:hypothetical protein
MSEIHPDSRDPEVGDFVTCFFPHMSKDPAAPSVNPHCAMIVGIGYDEELRVKTYTLVHSSREFENTLKAERAFTHLLREITGRVQITPTSDRVINRDYVVELPVCAAFFGELAHGAHINILASATPETIKHIMPKLAAVNRAALTVYRMEQQYADHGVRPTWKVDLHDAIEAKGNKLG